ncbi:unnamed protein product, partial [Meganyctiphanes norvegica]
MNTNSYLIYLGFDYVAPGATFSYSAECSVCLRFNVNLGHTEHSAGIPISPVLQNLSPLHCGTSSVHLHTSAPTCGLDEFFDDKKNWGEQTVIVGRSWKKDELRIKSNEDLHKLWYVLLKERNMLLTMENAYKEEYQIFASPERNDKVNESMRNLEDVIKERNRAYHLLETGETGERESSIVKDQLGRNVFRPHREYRVPLWMNKKMLQSRNPQGAAVSKFVRSLKEQKHVTNIRATNRHRKVLTRDIRTFPDSEQDAAHATRPVKPKQQVHGVAASSE